MYGIVCVFFFLFCFVLCCKWQCGIGPYFFLFFLLLMYVAVWDRSVFVFLLFV